MNAQDVDIYVFLKDGAYLYEAKTHSLIEVVSGGSTVVILPAKTAAASRRRTAGEKPPVPGQPGQQPPKPGERGQQPPAGGSRPQEQQVMAPVVLLLVSDISRFRAGNDDLKKEWGRSRYWHRFPEHFSFLCRGRT
jgi:hypothetical protein